MKTSENLKLKKQLSEAQESKVKNESVLSKLTETNKTFAEKAQGTIKELQENIIKLNS